jgi:diaminohydroxyphosphoribosylaminopyrimidine deaminase/5-amino-6-(5-phosphoribosylamino)uracil reductase
MEDLHTIFMARALELAALGLGRVSPNPVVGCVIVNDGKIIGEGYHHEFGGPHAEVEAIKSVKDKSLLPSSDVYVTLEPCAHHGKTPPCADMLASYQVRRVFIAQKDPNPLVDGEGIRKLERANIDVVLSLLEKEATYLNRRFTTYYVKKRPYVILKWAQTADGFIARPNYDSKWISNPRSRQLVHRWRTEEDAILVGKNTARYDNPRLTSRDWTGGDPTRVVIDHRLELDYGLSLFDGSVKTYRYYVDGSSEKPDDIKLGTEDFEKALLDDLYEKKIQSLFIEGGAKTIQRFIDLGLWDEARVFVSSHRFEKGIDAPTLDVSARNHERLQSDKLYYYENPTT